MMLVCLLVVSLQLMADGFLSLVFAERHVYRHCGDGSTDVYDAAK